LAASAVVPGRRAVRAGGSYVSLAVVNIANRLATFQNAA
jgi:hypothetical protein